MEKAVDFTKLNFIKTKDGTFLISNILDIANVETTARIAVYDDMLSSPRIINVEAAPILEFIENITTRVYDLSHNIGGRLPYSVIREIAENFIHADFTECTVSILDGGNTLRFSDQGPGIEKKTLVLQPGVSSASSQMKQFIKGVGSGFPIVQEYLGHSNGFMTIDDNAASGTVITLVISDNQLPPQTLNPVIGQETQTGQVLPAVISNSFLGQQNQQNQQNLVAKQNYQNSLNCQNAFMSEASTTKETKQQIPPIAETIVLQSREEQALLLLLEKGMLGSSELAEPLGISKPTATRLLQKLERIGMVEIAQFKKRILSNAGLAYAQQLRDSS